MKQVLTARNIQLTKSLGQNFLHDRNQLARIIAAADLQKSDKVLEIGPGLGPLTEELAKQAGEILAIEKDLRLVEILKQRLGSRITLLHDDGLEYLRREPRNWGDWKLVSNLPYSVASPILVEMALSVQPPPRMVATLQLEVARRLTARAGDDDYGLLSVLVQLNYLPSGSFRIPASCFFPAPDVDSACVTLSRRMEPLVPPGMVEPFTRIVKRGFSQRRKMLLKLLKQDWPVEAVEEAFGKLGVPVQVRAEDLQIEQFVSLAKLLTQQTQR